ncbi:hypothetical protein [Anaerolentibacter hominis]|uniref:hypothetical protein n=1 Tax=Anaerolentibacter hominis TaxID=3079009 RepID=UPI0031B8957F
METKRKNQLNNRGSSLLFVIAALAVIGVMAALSLSAASANTVMKAANRESEKNFYHVEQALDEIYVGLGEQVSDTFKDAYQQFSANVASTMVEYAKNNHSTDGLEFVLQNLFRSKCIQKLEVLFYMGDDKALEKSRQFLSAYSPTVSSENMEVGLQRIEFGGYDVTLRGLSVKNINAEDVYSSITTDLTITVPDLTELMKATDNGTAILPAETAELLNYALIGADQVQILGTDFTALGNVYAGDGGLLCEDGTDSRIQGNRFVSPGDIVVYGASLAVNSSQVWARNINTEESGEDGRTPAVVMETAKTGSGGIYVQDDLAVNGTGSQLDLSGNYYGFSYGSGMHRQSSAITVNAQRSVVNMTDLKKLFLAGHAYLDFYAGDPGMEGFYTYPLAESLSLSVDQNLYLIQRDYLVEGADRNVSAVVNGISYKTGYGRGNNADLFNEEHGYYGVQFTPDFNLDELLDPIKPVYSMLINNKVYLYWNFVNEEARIQFLEYCIKQKALDPYLESFMDGGSVEITAPSGSYINGRLFRVRDNKASLVGNRTVITPELKSRLDEMKRQFASATVSLETEEGKTAWRDMIFFDQIYGGNGAVYCRDNVLITAGDLIAAPDGSYLDQDGNVIDFTAGNGILIASGDIIIQQDAFTFTGLVIAGGSVRIEGSSVRLIADAAGTAAILHFADPSLMDYLDIKGITGQEPADADGNGESTGNSMDLEYSFMTLSNWTKNKS